MEHGDLINEALLRAYEGLSGLKNERAFLSFIIGIALRVLSNSHRKKRPERIPEGHDAVDSSQRTDHRVEVDMLYRAMSHLPTEQRESLILFEINGFAIKEIAEVHGVGESAVKQRLRRGRIALATLLREKEVTSGQYHGE